jgi:hypothetical protein
MVRDASLMSEPKYITGMLGSEQAVEGFWRVVGDKVEVYGFEQTVKGVTSSPGALLKSQQLEEGDDPRMVALKVLRDKATSGRGYFGATGKLPYKDLGFF